MCPSVIILLLPFVLVYPFYLLHLLFPARPEAWMDIVVPYLSTLLCSGTLVGTTYFNSSSNNQPKRVYVIVDARILDNQLLPSSSRSDKFRTPHCLALSGLVGSSSVDSGANWN